MVFRIHAYVFIVFISGIFLSGCGVSDIGAKGDNLEKDEKRQKWIFWQTEKPEIQMDPVEEEDSPLVITPMKDEE